MKYDFIEIGTSDFDTCIQKAAVTGERGMSVEPLQEYLDRLPDVPSVTKVNVAISDAPGTETIYYLSPEDITNYKMPYLTRGCQMLGRIHPVQEEHLALRGYDPAKVIRTKDIPVWTYEQLAEKYEVNEPPGFLKIDTEGNDWRILDAALNYWLRQNAKGFDLFPRRLLFENNARTSPERREYIIKRLIEEGGYKRINQHRKEDCEMVR